MEAQDLKQIFLSAGLIAQNFPRYEYRPQQLEMARAVEKAIKEKRHLIAEAPTGVGKSFAYSVPLIYEALASGQRVVISTNTISLQEQLTKKDIPFLQKVLPKKFKVVLVKGRANYLCPRKLERAQVLQADLFSRKDEETELKRISEWADNTTDGTLSDLSPQPGLSVWDTVNSEKDNCLGRRCPYHKDCFFQEARRQVYSANLLIVNHHLFFSDLHLRMSKQALLPDYRVAVLDEAHNIENIATQHLGIEISNFGVKYLLDRLYNPRTRKGFLVYIKDRATIDLVSKARKSMEKFFTLVEKFAEGESIRRLRAPDFVENLIDADLKRVCGSLKKALAFAPSKEDELQIKSYLRRISELNYNLGLFLGQKLEGYVWWVEVSKKRRYHRISLNSAPINVSTALREYLFKEIETIILTSATLATDKRFDYLRQRLGLDDAAELITNSPFDFKRQVKLHVPASMPDPNDFEKYKQGCVKEIKRYLAKTHGKAFVLFTSYKLMNEVYEELSGYLEQNGIVSFKQGDGLSRHQMLEAFKKNIDSVLFGTDSFWQGVDVAGKALSSVIITRLPFSVPDHPIVEARIEDLREQGKDPFIEYSLPEAVIRLKQGFGRLIRRKDDAGVVVILDNRIINRTYGKTFLRSLPECKLVID